MKNLLNIKNLKKYSRQIILKSIGPLGQKKILTSNVLLVGAGGLGCPIADYLSRAGIGEMGVVDDDKVDLSNLHRQSMYNHDDINKFKVDQFLGEIRNDGEYVNIILRDHEYPDGDLIKVEVNENVVMPAILLTEKAKGFKLDLKSGFNVVDFVALNQGSSGPNTAEIIVYDDQGKLVGTNRWNLATGVKATYIIYKE